MTLKTPQIDAQVKAPPQPHRAAAEPDRPAPQRIPFREQLRLPNTEYRSGFGKWLAGGESLDDHAGKEVLQQP